MQDFAVDPAHQGPPNRRSPKIALPKSMSYAGRSNSVLYPGARALALATNSASAFSSSFGGGVVRAATGTPTLAKNSSYPAGEQMHNRRAARSLLL